MKSHKFIAPKWWAVNLRNGGHPPRSRAAKKKILIVERWGKYILEEYDRIRQPNMVYDLVCTIYCTMTQLSITSNSSLHRNL